MAAVIFTGPYRIPKMAVTSRSAYTNTCPRAPYRGPWQFETFAREQAVDALARAMDLDPLELRRRNVLHRDELPYTMPIGLPLVDVSPEETLEQAAAVIDYDALPHAPARRARGGPARRARDRAVHRAAVDDGRVREPSPRTSASNPTAASTCTSGSGSHGQGIETTTAQLVSEFLGVALRRRHRAPGRHERDALRVRHRRQPQRTHPRRLGAGCRARAPHQGARGGGPSARGVARRPRGDRRA